MTTHNSSVMIVFLAKDLNSPFFLTYFCGLAFNPQVVHFLKFYNLLYIISAFISHVHALISNEFETYMY